MAVEAEERMKGGVMAAPEGQKTVVLTFLRH